MKNNVAIPVSAGQIILTPRKNSYQSMGPAPVTPVSPGPITCFLAGSTVTMADYSTKRIEEVESGEFVVGAFGEINEVLALDRTMLGNRPMYRINGEHSTTAEHPHVGVDKKFYAQDTEATYAEYGTEHQCLVKDGSLQTLTLHGVDTGKINSLYIGIELQTIYGGKIVKSVEKFNLSESTLLFNLVLSGSHTYFVDGYAVGGWLRDDDFDYENWKIKDVPKITTSDYNIFRNAEYIK